MSIFEPVASIARKTRLWRLARLTPGLQWLDFASLIRANYLQRNEAATLRFRGHDLTICDAASFLHTFEEIFLRRIYDFNTDAPLPFVIDAGANIGLASIFFKELLPESRVIAIEPDPAICRLLRGNLAAQQCSDVEIVEAAVSDRTGHVSFQSDGATGGRTGETGAGIEVDAIALVDLLVQPVTFLKIDIEGAELEVLRSCADRLSRVENMFVEFHSFADRPQRLAELLDIVTRAGFRYLIQTERCAPRPFLDTDPHAGMDLQLNVFCVRQ